LALVYEAHRFMHESSAHREIDAHHASPEEAGGLRPKSFGNSCNRR